MICSTVLACWMAYTPTLDAVMPPPNVPCDVLWSGPSSYGAVGTCYKAQQQINDLLHSIHSNVMQPRFTITTGYKWKATGLYLAKTKTLGFAVNATPVMTISANGEVTWKGHKVRGDDEFRRAMVDLAAALTFRPGPCRK